MSESLEQALASAYAYLSRRDRTTAQMRMHLQKRTDCDTEAMHAIVAELTEKAYLDDVRFARCFAEDRRNLDNWGTQRIYRRLLELGIEQETAQQASQPEDEEQELQAALELIRRRVRSLEHDPRARQRALEMLMRRGYPAGVAYKAVSLLGRETSASVVEFDEAHRAPPASH